MRRPHLVVVLFAILVVPTTVGTAAAINGPRGVSPGALDRVATMRDGCTTFSWQEVEGAVHYELVAYELMDGADVDAGLAAEQAREVLYTRVAGGATSWTPEAADCLAPGGRYAWFVRAVLDDATEEATEWSEPMLFAVPAAPTLVEVELALEVLLRYVEEDDSEIGQLDRQQVAALARSAGAKAAGRSVETGTAAIRGEQPDASGETYGVVGTSASPDGAGLGAANTAGGPDLVLDGSAAGVSDAEFSEAGIDRPSASSETFTIGNSGGGGMIVRVDGVDVTTTATDQDTVGALSCAADEIPKFVGGIWICAPDVDTDTDTLAGLMCSSGQVAKLGSHGWECSPDDDTLGDLSCGRNEIAKWDDLGSVWECARDENSTYISGNGITVIDGQVSLNPAWFTKSITNLDGPDHVGWRSSVALGNDGLPLIAYSDQTNGSLKVAHCDGALCSSASIRTLDDGGGNGVGSYVSVAIGVDGFPLIAYYDSTDGDLKVAHCDDAPCSGATITTIPSQYNVGRYPSVAIGGDGLGLISLEDQTNHNLRVAHCSNALCTAYSVQIVDSDGLVGAFTSLAIGTDGFGLISYLDSTNGDLKVAHCSDALCSSSTITSLDTAGNVGSFSSIEIGSDGLGLISYRDTGNESLKVAHCDDLACTGASVTTLDTPHMGWTTSITIGSDGFGLISYYDTLNDDLKIARCRNLLCNSWTLSVVDVIGNVGEYSSITIGADGLPIVSYHDDTNLDLKVAHLPYGY